MKKFTFIFVILISLIFTSCIDYVQSITYKDGKYQMYYKITLSKVLFALGDKNPNDIFDEFDEEALSDLPANVEVKPVSTDLEVGAEFTLSIEPRTTDEKEKEFLPTVDSKKCFIPFLFGNNTDTLTGSKSSGGDGEAIAEAIMSSAKCRILISKKVIPEIETAYFEGREEQDYSVALFDYGESWCAEIPFILLMDEPKYKFDRLVIIKK